MLGYYKVIVPRSGDSGGMANKEGKRKVIRSVRIIPPNSVCTETYLVIGIFAELHLAERMATYARSKFFRYMLMLDTPTQDVTKKNFLFVPAVPLDRHWTDQELYAHFDLSKDEMLRIENSISQLRALPASQTDQQSTSLLHDPDLV